MKFIGKDVLRPTATSIMRFFALTKKRHLILTGNRKAGKSTLLNEILTLSKLNNIPKITTWAKPKDAIYLRDEFTGETAIIGNYDESILSAENKMRPNKEGFIRLGLSAVKRCIGSECQWTAIDEIGYLEASCKEYCDSILDLMDKKRLFAAVRKQDIPFLKEICSRDDVCLVDLDNPYGNIGCVIMASGEGKRFGSNKLMADFAGKPIVQYVLEATEGVFEKRVVVTRHKEVVSLCEKQKIPSMLHNEPYRSDTVRLGIQAISENIDGCIFCMGDQPLIKREALEVMAMAEKCDKTAIWRVSSGENEGAPILFPKDLFYQLENLPQGKGGGFIAKENPERVRFVHAEEYELADIDSKEDLLRLEKYMRI